MGVRPILDTAAVPGTSEWVEQHLAQTLQSINSESPKPIRWGTL